MVCKKQHRYIDQFLCLTIAQDNRQGDRHKCAGYAYVEGLKDALNGK